MLSIDWFSRKKKKGRRYQHFDRPVGDVFAAKVMRPDFVEAHSFSPLIRYYKEEKRYDSNKKVTKTKNRPIMYASHRDACILSYYAYMLNDKLEEFYSKEGLTDSVIAYRPLGRSNYDFSSEAFEFAKEHSPVVVLAFDVSGFFDNLDHSLLKSRLKRLLAVNELPNDWFKVFRYTTRFRFVEQNDLKAHPVFSERMKSARHEPVATVAELKKEKIPFRPNPNISAGIPQGTPISAAFSNLYMIDFDVLMLDYCSSREAMYRRYSDDILIVCDPGKAAEIEAEVGRLLIEEKLTLSLHKTERTSFDVSKFSSSGGRAAQYLGFSLREEGAAIRESSLARQWRRMRRSFRRVRKVAEAEIAAGRADRVYTKKLRRRFTPLQFRNFSSYGRRSAAAFGQGEKISGQVRRFERAVEKEIEDLKKLSKP